MLRNPHFHEDRAKLQISFDARFTKSVEEWRELRKLLRHRDNRDFLIANKKDAVGSLIRLVPILDSLYPIQIKPLFEVPT